MTKGITYFCTDRHGNVYNRYSARHVKPEYTHARVMRNARSTHAVGKGGISYASRYELARARMSDVERADQYARARNGKGYEGEVIPVRAYPGRHTSEPEA